LQNNTLARKLIAKITKIIGPQKLVIGHNLLGFIKSDDWKHADSYHYVNIPGDLNRQQFDLL
jgi:hypothetical protein